MYDAALKSAPGRFTAGAAPLAAIAALGVMGAHCAFAATDYRDTLDRAVAAPDEAEAQAGHLFEPYVADSVTYDSNLFRLPASVTDLTTIVGPDARREDWFNSASAGLNGKWLVGSRQRIDLDLRVDDNRYKYNDDLNNVSTDDRLVWNWGLGGVFSGQVGANYSRYLASFVNTDVYTRNLIDHEEYYAAARFQPGPRWALFGGLMDSKNSLSDPQSTVNNSHRKAVDIGVDFATNASNTIGADYRYTDSRSPNPIVLGGETFAADFREDRAQVLVNYAFTAKTLLYGSAGYIKRDYSSAVIGNFSGEIWRLQMQWQVTEKSQLVFAAWRQLQADLTAESDYFVSQGGSISPVWNATDKLTLSIAIARDERKYVGQNPGAIEVEQRRDNIDGARAALDYKATAALSFTGAYSYERRESNQPQFPYDDNIASVGVKFIF